MVNNAILMPDVIIYKTLKSIFNIVKKDYDDAPDKEKTILYDIFGKDENDNVLEFETFNYFNQAVEIFVLKQPQINIGYNMEVSAMGCVHILLPSETGKDLNIGASENYQDYDEDGEDVDGNPSRYKEIYNQMYDTTYNLMITSENTFEVILIYNLLKASFIALNAHIELAGLRLPKVSGQDVNIQSDLVPTHIFHRSLMLNFQYECNVSDFFYKTMVRNFNITGIIISNP